MRAPGSIVAASAGFRRCHARSSFRRWPTSRWANEPSATGLFPRQRVGFDAIQMRLSAQNKCLPVNSWRRHTAILKRVHRQLLEFAPRFDDGGFAILVAEINSRLVAGDIDRRCGKAAADA